MKKDSKCECLISKAKSTGDKLLLKFDETNNLSNVKYALSAYNTAVNAARAQLIYKKLTGDETIMPFFDKPK